MRHVIYFFKVGCLLLLPGVVLSQDLDIESWHESTPSYTLFSKGIIKECPKCETFVIIASTNKVSDKLTNTLKKLTERVNINSSHQGVIIRRDQLLSQVNEITALNCRLPNVDEKNVLFYANRTNGECIKLPYESEDFLRVALENIYGYFDDREMLFIKINEANNTERQRIIIEDAKKFFGNNFDYIKDLLLVLAENYKVKKFK